MKDEKNVGFGDFLVMLACIAGIYLTVGLLAAFIAILIGIKL